MYKNDGEMTIWSNSSTSEKTKNDLQEALNKKSGSRGEGGGGGVGGGGFKGFVVTSSTLAGESLCATKPLVDKHRK